LAAFTLIDVRSKTISAVSRSGARQFGHRRGNWLHSADDGATSIDYSIQ